MQEPGLDRHDWQTEWEQLEPDLETSPAEALPEVDRLIARMLAERGHTLDDPDLKETPDPEITTQYLEAHRIARLVDGGEQVDPGDIGAAIEGFRELYSRIMSEEAAP